MNTEIVKVARKAASHYKNSDGYAQAAEIITMLCDELEKTQRPVAPPTVKDVLLKTWAQDTVKMAKAMISLDTDEGFLAIGADDEAIGWSKNYNDVLATQIAYLNSAAEGATK